jgi:hypothetical protein
VVSRGPRGREARIPAMRIDVRLWAAEALTSWVVRRALEAGYRRATGRDLPTARDRTAPMRQVLVWTATTAVAVAVAGTFVDAVVLRSEPRPLPGPAG